MADSLWILIVDDEAKLRYTLSVILKRAGFSVIGVENASQALRQIATRQFHLLFLDIGLADSNGLLLLAEIHRTIPHLPVVILTGDDSVETTLKAMRLGACGYLLKPINPWQILACIDQILSPAVKQRRSEKLLHHGGS